MYSIKSHAKINTFLKITGHKDGYHTLISRFIKLHSLYDELQFVPASCNEFTIEGVADVEKKENSIYKAFIELNRHTGDLDLLNFFHEHKVVIKKNIPMQAGLGGGSSNAGAFLRLINDLCNLGLSKNELAAIGSNIGADVAFFVYDYDAANVTGFGEIVEPFEEDALEFELFFPQTKCDTRRVYRVFEENFLGKIEPQKYIHWMRMKTKDIIQEANSEARRLNDLYKAALKIYPKLEDETPKGWLFSGSGSTFFKLKD
ncbi:MAG: 4-(cytidine 5'-diphospho)-2-C-methyl-D-erythritol kinase [Campylobacterales bacterium]|nr:4-(cytidine 5'-diphospho)-2-C-methyl-D-erythritol kinase [Campylobacterales bacterium]